MDTPCLLICPGFHRVELTQHLVQGLKTLPTLSDLSLLIYPAETIPGAALSGYGIRQFLLTQLGRTTADISRVPPQPVFFLAFSAGCVGAIATAHHWHSIGGTVGAFFAVDGWGVPLVAPFPVHRLSHDRFTHDTSILLGSDHVDFYADPAVSHLELWSQFSQVQGQQVLGCKVEGREQASPLHRSRFSVPGAATQEPTLFSQSVSLTAGQFLQTHVEKVLDSFSQNDCF